MKYRYEYPALGGGTIMSREAYPRKEAVSLLLASLGNPKYVVFGNGFWTRTGVYLARIVASDSDMLYTDTQR